MTSNEATKVPDDIEPRWFCWLGTHRAEFLTLDEALAWQTEHGGLVTDDPRVSVDEQGEWSHPDTGAE